MSIESLITVFIRGKFNPLQARKVFIREKKLVMHYSVIEFIMGITPIPTDYFHLLLVVKMTKYPLAIRYIHSVGEMHCIIIIHEFCRPVWQLSYVIAAA